MRRKARQEVMPCGRWVEEQGVWAFCLEILVGSPVAWWSFWTSKALR